ncbi:MAG: type II CAAX endopeptidase family protein [Prevotellaceae bacterium]|nr:CPBP family intramembrane metalloprotease [Prevotella sp.]MDD7256982.1 type II CAAX endopeptidase family protein [Prevotellaceae bacterium]MDY6130369.1 type II CAAX endopeptidase family protein [Prevotella sp.]
MKKTILYTAMFFVLQSLAYFLVKGGHLMIYGKDASMGADALLLIQMLFGVLCIVLFLWRRWTPVSTRYFSTRPYSVFLWCIVASLGTFVPSMWLQEQIAFLPDLSGSGLLQIMQTEWGYFAIGILVPLSEEIVFRGAILRSLLDFMRNRKYAVILSALIFAVIHLNPAQMPHAFLMGLLLGWLYMRTGSILPGTVLHVVNNTATYIVASTYIQTPDITLHQIFGGNDRSVLLGILFSLCLLLPALFQLYLRTKK